MAVTPNYGWPVPVATDYVKDGWQAISDLGNAIDTTVAGLSSGAETVLTSGTITTQSALNLSNVLSDTYKFYRFYQSISSSGLADILFRFRENTTDKTTNYYGGGNYGYYNGTTGSFYAVNNGTAGYTAAANLNTPYYAVTTIYRGSATEGAINTQGYINTTDGAFNNAYINGNMTNYNGFSLIPTSGTISGNYILTGIK